MKDHEIAEIQAKLIAAGEDPSDFESVVRAAEDHLLNTPELADFARGAVLEAQHQRRRWRPGHDGGKTPADWHWLLAHLAGKALHHANEAEYLARLPYEGQDAQKLLNRHREKALHHTVTVAAAAANWHSGLLARFGAGLVQGGATATVSSITPAPDGQRRRVRTMLADRLRWLADRLHGPVLDAPAPAIPQDAHADDDLLAHAWSISSRLAATPEPVATTLPDRVQALVREAQGLHPDMAGKARHQQGVELASERSAT